MGNFAHSAKRLGRTAALAAVVVTTAGGAMAGRHPSLVDPAKAKCATCHEETLAKPVHHAPAEDDCRSCHEFSKREGQTWVELAAAVPALCTTCHDGLAAAAAGTLAAPHAPVIDDCGACHTPHSSQQARLLKDTPQALCLSCHAQAEVDKAHPLPVARAACLSCHLPHGGPVKAMLAGAFQHAPFAERSCDACHKKGLGSRPRLAATGADLCYACHSDLEERFGKGSVHSAVKQGRCTGCHAPHLSSEAKLLKARGTALCTPCHAAIKEKVAAPGAHAAATEGCDTCHDPHRSDVAPQLVAPVPELCLTCHDAADSALAAAHLGADLAKAACTTCHDPHGSKEKGLIAAGSVHPPFAERSCDSCHEGSASKLVENGDRKLCYACHSEVEESIASAKVRHAALDAAECVACHLPHASAQPRLISSPAGGECLGCHDDKSAGKGEVAHGATLWFGCQACHAPHGGDRAKLLRAPATELCLSCHDPKHLRPADGAGAVKLLGRFEVAKARAREIRPVLLSADGTRDHPVTGHRALGAPTGAERKARNVSTTFKGELSCLACHDPHKGRSSELLAGAAAAPLELCQKCHEK